MHLVIDANALLDFYRMAKSDLKELKKVVELIDRGEIVLYLTEQLKAEVARNRETVIAESLRTAREAKLPTAYTQILRSQADFQALDQARKDYAKLLESVVAEAQRAAQSRELAADQLLDALFSKAKVLPTSPAVYESAVIRVTLGNPPGKNGSHGDAVNWETLLGQFPEDADLHLVTGDRDFVSPLDRSRLRDFLADEWSERKRSSVHVYDALGPLLARHHSEIRLAAEQEVQRNVTSLVRSGSYARTHSAIAALVSVAEFTDDQANEMARAATSNDQISALLGDADVNDFFWGLLRDYGDVLESGVGSKLMGSLDEATWPDRATS